jgi:8-oxo-dGTP diphosphatase
MKKLSPEVLRTHKGISFVGVTTTFLCHDGKGNFVMAKRGQNARDEQGRWEIGAGGLKAGTPILENVKREIKEEYNAQALEIEYMGYRDMHRKLDDGTPTHWVALDFAVLVDPKQVDNNEPEILDAVEWFTLDKLPSPLHSQGEIYLKIYKKQLAKILKLSK